MEWKIKMKNIQARTLRDLENLGDHGLHDR